MKYLVPGWVHRPGAHCASTAISDAMTFRGIELSEAICFGLGAGLGFAYFEHPRMSPSRMTATRNRLLEPRFFETLGQPFDWIREPDPGAALETVKRHLSERIPVLLRADIAHLPYYRTGTHFPPHVVGIWGFDDEQKIAFIADTGWPGLQEVPYPYLEKARYGGNAYIQNQADHFPVTGPEKPPDLRSAARHAIAQQARDLLGLELEIKAVFGFDGMGAAARSMPKWGEAPDWQWCARWFYQVIEKRGTGGGAFRLLYSRFLEEIAELDPAFKTISPAGEMKNIAAAWTELSELLKEISEQDDPGRLEAAARRLADIAGKERKFFTGALERLQ